MIVKCNFEDKAEKSFSVNEIYKFLTKEDLTEGVKRACNTEAMQHIIAWLPMIAIIDIHCYSDSHYIDITFTNGEKVEYIYTGIEVILTDLLPDIEIIR